MKKIKKFKIIEEGRICSPEEMKEIVGGYLSCSDGNSLTVCPTDWFLASCQPAATSGYSEEFCLQLPPTYIVCSEDYKYDFCVGMHYTCGGENTYTA